MNGMLRCALFIFFLKEVCGKMVVDLSCLLFDLSFVGFNVKHVLEALK